MNNEIDLMDTQEVSELFRKTRRTIRRWCDEGFPHIRVGKSLLFHRRDIHEIVNGGNWTPSSQ
jgi:excisionase family DNA binding protein